MKNKFSFTSLVLIGIMYIVIRLLNTNDSKHSPIKVTSWDALGYYMYLPAAFIYKDVSKLNFYDSMEIKYKLQGASGLYQFEKLTSGNKVGKYFIGVSILQAPYFFLANFYASNRNAADGFSIYYQYAIAWGLIFWVLLSLVFFRRFLLKYFPDYIVALALLIIMLATNAPQYIAVEAGMSHGWIFPLYIYQLIFTDSFYKNRNFTNAFAIGLILGLAIICRPTETVMMFIPLLWAYNPKEGIRNLLLYGKYKLVAVLSVLIVLLFQMKYWHIVTGSCLHIIGSKWDFLNPNWRVLIGPEKGWIIYTPLCLLMLLGIPKLKKLPFGYAILTTLIFNVWIVVAWHDWQYGASYSCRALVQMYPLFIFPLLLVLQLIWVSSFRNLFMISCIYFISLNLFQVYQYNKGIIHYNRNTFSYYLRVYWKSKLNSNDLKYLKK